MQLLRSFFREWFRFMLFGQSVFSFASKIVGFVVVAMGLIKLPLLKTPVILSVWFSSWTILQNWTLGEWLLLILAIVYICFAAGIAWVRATSQAMYVSHELEPDPEHNRLRLLVVNRGRKSIHPTATIVWLESDNGQDHTAVMPIKCDWMHGDNEAPSYGTKIKVDVAGFSSNQIHFGNFTAKFHRGIMLGQQAGESPISVSFCVRVVIPDTTAVQERAFRLEPDQNYPFELRPIRLRQHKRNRWLA